MIVLGGKMASYILAIDQGTTSTRSIIFDGNYSPIASDQMEFTQHFPSSGWVEHEAEEIWKTVLETSRNAIAKAGIEASSIAGIGITNQRETVVIWDKDSGEPIHKAIVWQDRRTSEYCASLKANGVEEKVTAKTGLLLDPYFSATKIRWLLENVDGARAKAENGKLLFGTIDTYLLWKLTGGKSHKTDATNAARTLIYNIRDGSWDDELLALFEVPRALLPSVEDTASNFGETDKALFGASIPVLGIAGDQHAATLGQACFKPGMVKSTYGTGCFMMLNTGENIVPSKNRMLTTIAYQLNGKTTYALEGSIFIAGAAVQWLRDGLKIIDSAEQTGKLASQADSEQNVVLVPAFAGLGAPYWNADVRGAMFGLTRSTGPNEIAKAALEAACYQTRDLIEAMQDDWGRELDDVTLRVDGGMVASDWTMQFLSDILNAPIDRPTVLETTALGAAWLAGMKSGTWPDMDEFANSWKLERRFEASMSDATRDHKYGEWRSAINCLISK
jgi:glycerol kinase